MKSNRDRSQSGLLAVGVHVGLWTQTTRKPRNDEIAITLHTNFCRKCHDASPLAQRKCTWVPSINEFTTASFPHPTWNSFQSYVWVPVVSTSILLSGETRGRLFKCTSASIQGQTNRYEQALATLRARKHKRNEPIFRFQGSAGCHWVAPSFDPDVIMCSHSLPFHRQAPGQRNTHRPQAVLLLGKLANGTWEFIAFFCFCLYGSAN